MDYMNENNQEWYEINKDFESAHKNRGDYLIISGRSDKCVMIDYGEYSSILDGKIIINKCESQRSFEIINGKLRDGIILYLVVKCSKLISCCWSETDDTEYALRIKPDKNNNQSVKDSIMVFLKVDNGLRFIAFDCCTQKIVNFSIPSYECDCSSLYNILNKNIAVGGEDNVKNNG